jgi:nucleoside transporter
MLAARPRSVAVSDRFTVTARLALMMFTQYFAVGAWLVPLSRFLGAAPEAGGMGFSPPQVGHVYSTFALGGLIAPLYVGLLADRFVSADGLLRALHAVMAVLLAVAGWWGDTHSGPAADPAAAEWPLVLLMLGYNVCCLATLTLTNVIAFRHLPGGREEFGRVRLVGTLGWVVCVLLLGLLLNPVSGQPLYLGAAASATLAAARFLPATPPKGVGRPLAEVVGLPAIKLLSDRRFQVFAVTAFGCNVLNQFYVVQAVPYLADIGVPYPEAVSTVAQVAEMGCMAAVPWLLPRVGLKGVFLLGLGGWLVRAVGLWAGGVPLAVGLAVPLHGVSFAFFGIVGAVFVDRQAPPHLRAGAQALVVLLTSGPATLAGNALVGQVVQAHRAGGVTDWPAVWGLTVVGYAVAVAAFGLLFREPAEG